MTKRIILALIPITLLLTGCQTSSNMARGNEQSYRSIQDQRNAAITVKTVKNAPNKSRSLGSVEASRCHRSFIENEPAKDLLILDLKVAAYIKGANKITNIKIEKKSGLFRNCWYILEGKATAYK